MKLIQILSALLTPIIAVITTYIAYQQYRTNRAKLKHDLYEKRMSVYKATSSFILLADYIDLKKAWEFHEATDESSFLFHEEIATYLKEVEDKGMQIAFLKHAIKDPKLHNDKQASEIQEIREWFKKQQEPLPKKFMEYLNLKMLK